MNVLQFWLIPIVLLLISVLAPFTDATIRRVRKNFARRPIHDAFRRSPADDALDMAAAEEIFKDTQKGKFEGRLGKELSKHGHFQSAIEEEWDDDEEKQHEENEHVGAPSAQPTAEQLAESTTPEPATTTTTQRQIPKEELEESESQESEMKPSSQTVEQFLKDRNVKTIYIMEHSDEDAEHSQIASKFNRRIGQTNGRTWHETLYPYDYRVSPEYAQTAPYARGLVGIPDGWNTDKQVDEDFKLGYVRGPSRSRSRFN